ncbi:thymidine phosphorylase [Longimicrobium terrae]|uniref:thymidine phosphorylase n=1 Tax=Longimicrobium terrae TaxID=1639882 RepID=A0A841H223_9BACT|nr:pyrimidine-nucleoside phosphorylase [Longimicrobium terrae]MBB6072077.1 pyrimidine-nucleoside phosphorylase [Longimicrobium terrae]NNC29839.1 thymidine phosphorylase [Longimicrobium terrae]
MSAPSAVELIERKKRGGELTPEELRGFLAGYVSGEIRDYQVASWLMAVCWRGMTERETLALTEAMVESGATLEWPGLDRPTVDKHSTGGVGDKTSVVLVPLMAAAGAAFVKMSGRGLGHTGGTLDKLEAIPGFRCELPLDKMRAQVLRIGAALVGQSGDLVPADKKLYALRDVTGTVDSIPLIAGSIMSKKLAGGARSIVLDVKWGSGAFMQTLDEARVLARTLVRIGEGAGRSTRAVLSSMRQPLGRAVGNALEIREAIDTLRGGGPADLWALTLELGAQLLEMSGLAPDEATARARLTELRDSGAGSRVLEQLIEAQHGDPRVVENPDILPAAPVVRPFTADAEGWIEAADARGIGDAALALGAGRRTKDDPVDPAVGIVVRARIGDRVQAGQPLADIHARTDADADAAIERLRTAFALSTAEVAAADDSYETIG